MADSTPLFPGPTASWTGPLGMSEPAVHFLAQSSRPQAHRARANINAWFGRFPDAGGRLRRSLTSEDDRTHYGALDELFIHEQLLNLGFEVRYEEDGRGPDFRCYRDGRQRLAVEVASIFMKKEWEAEEKAFGGLADRVNAKASPRGFFVHLEVMRMDRLPSSTGLFGFLDRWIDTLPDPTIVSAGYQTGEPLPSKDYTAVGVHIRAEALPIRPGAASWTDPDFRLIGVGAGIGGIVDSHVRVRSILDGKRASRYDLEGRIPYVVALGNHDLFCSLEEVSQALYGPDQRATKELADLDDWERKYAQEAFFGFDLSSGTRKNTRIAAVAFFRLVPWEDELASFWYFEHPTPVERARPNLLPGGSWFRPSEAGWSWSSSLEDA